MYNHLVIDINNLFWRVITSGTEETVIYNNKEIITSGIWGALELIRSLEDRFLTENGTVWCLFDNPDSVIKLRKDIDPNYKSARENYSNAFNYSVSILKEVLKSYKDNFKTVQVDKLEADDLVNPVLFQIGIDNSVLLISSDMDWARSINGGVHWYNFKKVISLETFKILFGFYPDKNRIQMFKTFKGDKRDNIPYPFYDKSRENRWNISSELLFHIIDNCRSIDDFFTKLKNNVLNEIDEKWFIRFKACESRLRLNYLLVDFMVDPQFYIGDSIYHCKYNKTEFETWSKILNLESSQKDINGGATELTFPGFEFQKYNRI